MKKKKGAPCREHPIVKFYTRRIGLEVVVESKTETENLVDAQIVEVSTEAEVVVTGAIGLLIGDGDTGDSVGNLKILFLPLVAEVNTDDVKIQVGREVVVKLVVHTGNDVDAKSHAGLSVLIELIVSEGVDISTNIRSINTRITNDTIGKVGVNLGGKIVSVGTTVYLPINSGLAEEVEVASLHEIIAEVRSNGEVGLRDLGPCFCIKVRGSVSLIVNATAEGLIVVNGEVKAQTDLHFVIQHVANRGAKVEDVVDVLGNFTFNGGKTCCSRLHLTIDTTAIGVETDVTSHNKLCIGCKSESSECEG